MDYDIIYVAKDMIIGNIKAGSDEEALYNAQAIYGTCVTVERV